MLGQLALKGKMASETLNSIEGITCNEVMGAMYAFPRLHLPEKAIAEAKVCTMMKIWHYSKHAIHGYIRPETRCGLSKGGIY